MCAFHTSYIVAEYVGQQVGKVLLHNESREIPLSNFEVLLHHCSPTLGILQHLAYLAYGRFGEKPVDRNDVESLRFYIDNVDRITVYKYRFLEIYGFEEGIAEALIQTGVGDEVHVWIDVPECVEFLSLFVVLAGFVDPVKKKVHRDVLLPGGFHDPLEIIGPLVADRV